MNVWSYWRCRSCQNIIRGDNKSCPCCGAPIPNGVKYMMPDNPEVISAMDRGEIITGKEDYKKEVSSAGIVEEIVPKELESDKPEEKVYPSAAQASRDLEIDKTSISKCLRGLKPQAGGYKFIYYEREEENGIKDC